MGGCHEDANTGNSGGDGSGDSASSAEYDKWRGDRISLKDVICEMSSYSGTSVIYMYTGNGEEAACRKNRARRPVSS